MMTKANFVKSFSEFASKVFDDISGHKPPRGLAALPEWKRKRAGRRAAATRKRNAKEG